MTSGNFTVSENATIRQVMGQVLRSIQLSERIPYSKDSESPWGGTLRGLNFRFDGEEDLLHLELEFDPNAESPLYDARALAMRLLEGVPPALIYARPGETSMHYFLGHDDLAAHSIFGIPKEVGELP